MKTKIKAEELNQQANYIIRLLRGQRYIVNKVYTRPIWEIKLPVPKDAISFFLCWDISLNTWALVSRPGRQDQAEYQKLLTLIKQCTGQQSPSIS